MSRDRLPRHSPYARENVKFFVEDMITYVLRQSGVRIEFPRSANLEIMRAVAIINFTPSIGDAVIAVHSRHRDRVSSESSRIWDYVSILRPAVREDVLHSSLVVLGMRLIQESNGPLNLYILMAVVTELCERACRLGQSDLIDGGVSSLEYIFSNLVRGGFVRTIIEITNFALRQRIVRDVVLPA